MITTDILTLIGVVDTASTADMLAFRDMAVLEITRLHDIISVTGSVAKVAGQSYIDMLNLIEQYISVDNLLNRRNLS